MVVRILAVGRSGAALVAMAVLPVCKRLLVAAAAVVLWPLIPALLWNWTPDAQAWDAVWSEIQARFAWIYSQPQIGALVLVGGAVWAFVRFVSLLWSGEATRARGLVRPISLLPERRRSDARSDSVDAPQPLPTR